MIELKTRTELENMKFYIEKHRIAPFFNKLLQNIILQKPENPIDFLLKSVRNENIISLLCFNNVSKGCDKNFEYREGHEKELLAFVENEGFKIINNFIPTLENIERLRISKIYYDHLFVIEGKTSELECITLAVPLREEKCSLSLQVSLAEFH